MIIVDINADYIFFMEGCRAGYVNRKQLEQWVGHSVYPFLTPYYERIVLPKHIQSYMRSQYLSNGNTQSNSRTVTPAAGSNNRRCELHPTSTAPIKFTK